MKIRSIMLIAALLLALPAAARCDSKAVVSDYVVTDYGAVGDGRFDNAAILNALINRLPPQGGVLTFPSGEYVIGSPLVIKSNFVTLRGINRGWRSNVDLIVPGLSGPGGGSELLLAPSASVGILVPTRPRLPDGRANRITGIAIRDLLIRGAGTRAMQTGIDIEQDGDGLVVDDVSCINLGEGLLIKAADASRISGCLIAECRTCLDMEYGIQNLVTDCSMGAQPLGVTCFLNHQGHLLLTGCNIFPNGASAISMSDCQFCSVTNCIISVIYTGAIDISGSNNSLLSDNISAMDAGGSWLPDPLGRDGDWGLIRLNGDNNSILSCALNSDQPNGDVRINCLSGHQNSVVDVAVSGNESTKMVLVNGNNCTDTRVINSATTNEIYSNGPNPQVIVPIP